MVSLIGRRRNSRSVERLYPFMFLGICVFLTACATSPDIPRPRNENDTLLIFRLAQRKAPGADTVSIINLKIDTLDDPVVLKPWVRYTVVRGLTPGEHKTMTITFLPSTSGSQWYMHGGWKKPEPQALSIPFTMKPGECTVFPVKFVYVMEIDSISGNGRIRWEYEKLSEEAIRDELENLKDVPNFAYWQPDASNRLGLPR